MKKFTVCIWLCLFTFSAAAQTNSKRYALVIHGGVLSKTTKYAPEEEKAIRDDLTKALLEGKKILGSGGKSLDAVEAVIRFLEDSPLFNAGKGAVFTEQGKNELDASIMDGATLKAGAVASITRIKNPITLARMVMERTKHVMLVGAGAEAFAVQQGMQLVDPKYFFTPKRWEQLQKKKKEEAATQTQEHGTVGAVALDLAGNLAAGTSTGGTTNKKFGRVGDSPIIGAGTYANNRTCGVSCTGTGEYFIRLSIAHEISVLMRAGNSAQQAADIVMKKELAELGGDGAVIVLDSRGNVAYSMVNVRGLNRGWLDRAGNPFVKIYLEE